MDTAFASSAPSAAPTTTNAPQQQYQHQTMPLADKQFCMTTLKTLKKNRRSIAFLAPVDPVALNIPDYFDIVKQPMDLGTIETKLLHDQYSSVDAFKSDIELMFYNCHLYNHATDPVSQDAKKLEEIFHRAMEKRNVSKHHISSSNGITPSDNTAVETLMPDDQFKRCENALKEMRKSKYQNLHWPFLNPVDAVAWGATDYYDVIKRPMDISTLEKNLFEYKYANEQEFETDVRTMFNNCYVYNPPGHPVCQLGKDLEAVFDAYWAKVHAKAAGGTLKAKKADKSRSGSVTDMKSRTAGNTASAHGGAGNDTDMLVASTTGKRAHSSDEEEENLTTNTGTPTILRLKIPTAATKEQKPATQQQPNNNNDNASNLRLAISKKPPSTSTPPIQKLALASTPITSRTSNTHSNKRRAVADATTTKPTPPALSLGLSVTAPRRPPPPPTAAATATPTTTTMMPASAGAGAGTASATALGISNTVPRSISAQQHQSIQSKLGVRPCPDVTHVETPKPEQNILSIDTLFDQIEREKDIAKRQKREQQEQRERFEYAQREKELRRRQEEETKRKEWQIWAQKKRAEDHRRRLETFETCPTNISKDKLRFMEFEKEKLSRDRDWRELYMFQRDALQYHNYHAPNFVKNAGRRVSELKAMLLNTAVRYRKGGEKEEGEQDMDVE